MSEVQEQTIETPTAVPSSTINVNKVVVLVVEKHYLSTSKTVKSHSVDVTPVSGAENSSQKKPEGRWIGISKWLLSSPKLNAIYAADDNVIAKFERLRIPSPIRGCKLFPVTYKEAIDAELAAHVVNRAALVESFITTYVADIEAAKEALGGLFNQENYPEVDVARKNFSFDWKYIQFGISAEIEDGIQQLIRASLAELVTELKEKLTPDADGKTKIFRSNSMGSIKDFLATFSERNVTDDVELAKTVEQIRKLTSNINPDVIKNDTAIRNVVREEFAEIEKTLSGMITGAPRRKVRD